MMIVAFIKIQITIIQLLNVLHQIGVNYRKKNVTEVKRNRQLHLLLKLTFDHSSYVSKLTDFWKVNVSYTFYRFIEAKQ
jgi:hypothetical protein